jgi:serine/threonine-protein kinase SRK2
VGTPAYLAPEVITAGMGRTYDGKIADIWSCGVTLYVMLVGAYPFQRPEDKQNGETIQQMIQRILKVEYEFPSHVKLSPELRDFMSQMLVADPAKRITIAGILEHPWFNKGLPLGVKSMNNAHMEKQDNGELLQLISRQTEDDIKAVIAEARHFGLPTMYGLDDDVGSN